MQACYELNMREEFDITAFQQIDDNLAACEQYSDEVVSASVIEKQVTPEDNVIQLDDITPCQPVSQKQAVECLNMLRDFMPSSNQVYKIHIDQLFKIESAITTPKQATKQTTLNNFFFSK